MSAVALVGVKIRLVYLKALEMRMRKLVLNLSLAQILLEKINKMISLNNLGFIDVLSTVLKTFLKATASKLPVDSTYLYFLLLSCNFSQFSYPKYSTY